MTVYLGILLIFTGFVAVIVSLLMETTAAGVHNIGLISVKANFVLVSLAVLQIGVVVSCFAALINSIERLSYELVRKEPQHKETDKTPARIYHGEPDINDPNYVKFLITLFKVEKNEALGLFFTENMSFNSTTELLNHCDEKYRERLPGFMLAEAERKAEEHRAKEQKKIEESKADKRSMLFWALVIAAFALMFFISFSTTK